MNKLDELLSHVPTDLARQIKEAAWEEITPALCRRILYYDAFAKKANSILGFLALYPHEAFMFGRFGRPTDPRKTVKM